MTFSIYILFVCVRMQIVICSITALSLWDRLLDCCTSQKFRFSSDDVEDIYTEKVRGDELYAPRSCM